MKPKNVLISTKQTAYEYYAEKYKDLTKVLKPEDLAAVVGSNQDHYRSLNHVRKILESKNINYQRVYTPYNSQLQFKDRDLIIAIGGDGTVLNTAHYVLDETPVLTVRSEKKSVGALCTIDALEFESALDKICCDKFRIDKWTRAEGIFENSSDLALNEILVGPKYRSGAAFYEISFKGEKESHMSSGLIASTGAGSTGWYINVPGNKGKFPRTALELRFIVTEHNINYKLVNGSIKPGEFLEVRSLMNIDGVVSFDSDKQKWATDFKRGDKIKIGISDKPLHVITF